jgi:hypothetical protein
MIEKVVTSDFDLFISYVRRDVRRRAGGQAIDVVAVLKSELERHRRPSNVQGKDKRFRVCTDVDDFALDGTFDEIMRSRIARSRCFLLVASPSVASSKFVQRELAILKEIEPPVVPLAAVLGASLSEAAPGLFDPDVVAADLDQPDDTSLHSWRRALRRESHKIVGRVWGLDPRAVYDRFEAERRKIRHRIVVAGAGVALGFVALTIGLSGQLGYHRSMELPVSGRIVSPAGVGFGNDGQTPILIRDRRAIVWNRGLSEQPELFDLPFPALRAVPAGPGQIAFSGLNEVAIATFPGGAVRWTKTLPAQIEALASSAGALAASMKNGSLVFIDANGGISDAPRPVSQAGRRFPTFRETGPYSYGEVLALSSEFLASATFSGRLGILDRRRSSFITAATPQFPLAEPIERTDDPILYETENTRPISSLAFLQNGDLMFAEGAGLRLVRPTTGQLTMLSHCDIELVRQILPLTDGQTIVALTSSTLEVLRFDPHDRRHLECRQRTTLAPKSAPRAALAADNQTVLIAFFDAQPELWRPGFKIFGALLPLSWSSITPNHEGSP